MLIILDFQFSIFNFVIGIADNDASHHHAMLTQFLSQRTRIDTVYARDLLLLQPVAQAALGVPVAILMAVIPNDNRLGVDLLALHKRSDPVRLERTRRDTVVTNERISQHHQLACVRRVRQALRISGHSGIEHDLASHRSLIAERVATEDGTVV